MSPAVELSPQAHSALALAARGYRVFPLWYPDGKGGCACGNKCGEGNAAKHPIVRRGLSEATTDAGRITSWWLDHPKANIGVRTGDGLGVLDLDGEIGEASWLRLCREHGIDPDAVTARVLTGRGRHLWYRTEGKLKSTVSLIAAKVDTRGEGGYVVAPGSTHASGRQYVWDPDAGLEMIDALPAPLYGLANRERASDGAPDLGGVTVFTFGGRNKALASVAGSLRRRGLDGEAILAALLALNAAKCKPPLEEPEVKRIALSVARYPPASEATKPESDERASKAVKLLTLLEAQPIVLSPTGRFFAEIEGAALPLDGAQWAAWAAARYHRAHAGIVSQGLIKDCTRILQGRPQRSAEVPLRVGERDGVAWLDLGPDAGAVPLGQADDDALPPAFHRPSGTLPLPALREAGPEAIEELRAFLGFEHGHLWTCCVAWLMACLRPSAPYPVLFLQGEADSGKSTLGEILRSLVDPRGLESLGLPKGSEAQRNLAIQAEHAHILAYDNISGLDGDLSDAFCRIATGDGFAVRSLYSDRDQVVFRAARPALFTSIVDALVRPDLLSRSLIAQLPARATEEGRRVTPAELKAGVAARAGAVLGALVAAARSSRPVEVPPTVRMGGPCAFAAGAEAALGLPEGSVVAAYLASRARAHETEAEDPLVEALLEYLVPGTQVKLTYRQLLDELTVRAWGEGRAPSWWPTHGKALQAQLRRHAGLLRASKVTVKVIEEGHAKTKVLHLRRER